jgi:hypothetical protein
LINNDSNENFICEDNFITEDEEVFINENIVDSPKTAFFKNFSTSKNFLYLTHTMLPRGSSQPCSTYFPFFMDIFRRFVIKNKISVERILRATINLTFENSKYKFTDLHVDTDIPHKVFILYLNSLEENDLSSSTIIFDKIFDETKNLYLHIDENNTVENILKTIPIKHKISAKCGRAICFDGKYYHTGCFPQAGESRYIVVFNFD